MSTRAGRREWLGLAVLCLPTMLVTVDISIVILALPHLSRDLHAGVTQQLWITDIYGFMVASFLITMGALGDRVGRRALLLSGAAAFAVASIAAALSASPAALIASRAVLGVAAATLMPSILALISSMFRDPQQLGSAIGVWVAAIMAGLVLGPAIGGLLLSQFWWGSVFLLGVPVMAVLLLLGPVLLPEHRAEHAGPLDLVSVALSLLAILPVVYGLKELARSGFGPLPAVAIVVGLAVGLAFVGRQRGLAHPLVDLRLFTRPAISAALAIALLISLILGGLGLTATMHMQLVTGLSPLEVGLWLLPPTLLMAIGANVGPALARRIPPSRILVAGMLVAAAGMLVLTRVGTGPGVGLMLAGLVLGYAGASPIGPLVNHLLLRSAPPDQVGSVSALSSTAGELGAALGVAGMGSLATLVYRAQASVPFGVPGVAVDKAAFNQSLHAVGMTTAILFACLAVLAAIWLGRVPAPPGAAAGADHPDRSEHAHG